jgi:hypothetical protein
MTRQIRKGSCKDTGKINEKTRTKGSRSGKKCVESTGDNVEKEKGGRYSLKSYML